jgi:hypothetical protein
MEIPSDETLIIIVPEKLYRAEEPLILLSRGVSLMYL